LHRLLGFSEHELFDTKMVTVRDLLLPDVFCSDSRFCVHVCSDWRI
jgi:hypothetical protein